MANRNTRIRGVQVLYNTIDENHLTTSVAGDGLEGGNGTPLAVDLKANDGLEIDTGELTVDYDDATIGIISNALAVKDEGITEPKLNADNAPATTKVLGWSGSQLSWVEGITEANLVMNETLEPDTGSDVDYTLANSPVAGSVCVYLNGALQQPGTGEDYLISGSTITFAEAVDPSDTVLANYFVS